MRVKVTDKKGATLSEKEASALFKALGLGELWARLDTIYADPPRAVVEAVNAISKHGNLEYTANGFAGSVNASEFDLKIAATVKPAEDDPEKWEVVFTLPFEYDIAVSFLANAISELNSEVETLKDKVEYLKREIDNLWRRLRLEENRKRALKEEEEDYEEEDDW